MDESSLMVVYVTGCSCDPIQLTCRPSEAIVDKALAVLRSRDGGDVDVSETRSSLLGMWATWSYMSYMFRIVQVGPPYKFQFSCGSSLAKTTLDFDVGRAVFL